MGWGEAHGTTDRSSGSTASIELAHEGLDRLGIPGGSLAHRTLALIGLVNEKIELAANGFDLDRVMYANKYTWTFERQEETEEDRIKNQIRFKVIAKLKFEDIYGTNGASGGSTSSP